MFIWIDSLLEPGILWYLRAGTIDGQPFAMPENHVQENKSSENGEIIWYLSFVHVCTVSSNNVLRWLLVDIELLCVI